MFIKPTKRSIMYGLVMKEVQDLILGSLGIVCFLSFFVGGVVSIQTALNIDSSFIPENLVGFATRQSIILEFAPTFMAIILAGKVGSYITSSIGTMRVTEQIDAQAHCTDFIANRHYLFTVFRQFWWLGCNHIWWFFKQLCFY